MHAMANGDGGGSGSGNGDDDNGVIAADDDDQNQADTYGDNTRHTNVAVDAFLLLVLGKTSPSTKFIIYRSVFISLSHHIDLPPSPACLHLHLAHNKTFEIL